MGTISSALAAGKNGSCSPQTNCTGLGDASVETLEVADVLLVEAVEELDGRAPP